MIGSRIRQLRKRLDLTQTQFAEFIGINSRTVYEWENNKVEIKEKYLRKIEQVFAINSSWLRDGSGEIFPPYSTTDVSEKINDIFMWLKNLSTDEQAWVSIEMPKRFPEFKKWRNKK